MSLSVLPLPLTAEALLVRRLYAREEAAMTSFYDDYGLALYRVILRMVQCPLTAEDVLQESMVKIWYSFAHYDPHRGRLYTWALNICRHQAVDHLRTLRHRVAARTSSWDECPDVRSMVVGAFVPEHMDVRDSLRELRPAFRQLLELRYFRGFTQEEAAQELGIPLGTIKTHNRAALRQLAALFRCPPASGYTRTSAW